MENFFFRYNSYLQTGNFVQSQIFCGMQCRTLRTIPCKKKLQKQDTEKRTDKPYGLPLTCITCF